jgi:hypothetical protein
MKLYTKSKTPTNDWDGDDLSLLGVNRKQLITGLIDNKNCAAIITMQNGDKIQHIFAPVLADKINQDDSVTKNRLVVGNAVDNQDCFQPTTCNSSVFNMAVAFVKKDEAHPVFSLHKPIPTSYLEGTLLEGRKDIIAACLPVSAPIQFQSNVPYGNINDAKVQREFSQLGGEYQAWASLMKLTNKN